MLHQTETNFYFFFRGNIFPRTQSVNVLFLLPPIQQLHMQCAIFDFIITQCPCVIDIFPRIIEMEFIEI